MEIKIKNVHQDELDEVVRVEQEAWPPEIQAPREKFKSRLSIFPQGFFAAYVNGTMAAVSTSQIISYPNPSLNSWETITDNGFIRNSHNTDGNALYIVSLGVSSKYQGKGLGTRLLEAQKELTKRLNLKSLVLGSRMPWYHKYPILPVNEYLSLRNRAGEILDPEIRFYKRCGLEVAQVMPNYMQDDPESLNYGIVMHWENPFNK